MKGVKIAKINSVVPKKIIRGVLWGVIVIIMFRGVVGIIKPNDANKVYDKIEQDFELAKVDMNAERGANSFAENFAREFFTFKQGEGEEYRKRLSNYMTQQALAAVVTTVSIDSLVIDANAVASEFINEGKYNIDVRVKLQRATGINKDVYIKVPVTAVNGLYVVEEVPLLVAKPKLAELEIKQIDGTTVDTAIQKEVESMLNNFLKVYTEGSEGEINYYLSDATRSVQGLTGSYKFKSISELKVYVTDEENNYNAYVTYSIEDSETKQEIKQKVRVFIVNKDKRYYIEEIDTRTNN